MLLELDRITTYRGAAQVLRGVSLTVDNDEVVCLVGRNGAGRTTIIESITGIFPELTVAENLMISRWMSRAADGEETEARVFTVFPEVKLLRPRQGVNL